MISQFVNPILKRSSWQNYAPFSDGLLWIKTYQGKMQPCWDIIWRTSSWRRIDICQQFCLYQVIFYLSCWTEHGCHVRIITGGITIENKFKATNDKYQNWATAGGATLERHFEDFQRQQRGWQFDSQPRFEFSRRQQFDCWPKNHSLTLGNVAYTVV